MKKTVTNPRTWIDWQTQPWITHVGTRFRHAQKKCHARFPREVGPVIWLHILLRYLLYAQTSSAISNARLTPTLSRRRE